MSVKPEFMIQGDFLISLIDSILNKQTNHTTEQILCTFNYWLFRKLDELFEINQFERIKDIILNQFILSYDTLNNTEKEQLSRSSSLIYLLIYENWNDFPEWISNKSDSFFYNFFSSLFHIWRKPTIHYIERVSKSKAFLYNSSILSSFVMRTGSIFNKEKGQGFSLVSQLVLDTVLDNDTLNYYVQKYFNIFKSPYHEISLTRECFIAILDFLYCYVVAKYDNVFEVLSPLLTPNYFQMIVNFADQVVLDKTCLLFTRLYYLRNEPIILDFLMETRKISKLTVKYISEVLKVTIHQTNEHVSTCLTYSWGLLCEVCGSFQSIEEFNDNITCSDVSSLHNILSVFFLCDSCDKACFLGFADQLLNNTDFGNTKIILATTILCSYLSETKLKANVNIFLNDVFAKISTSEVTDSTEYICLCHYLFTHFIQQIPNDPNIYQELIKILVTLIQSDITKKYFANHLYNFTKSRIRDKVDITLDTEMINILLFSDVKELCSVVTFFSNFKSPDAIFNTFSLLADNLASNSISFDTVLHFLWEKSPKLTEYSTQVLDILMQHEGQISNSASLGMFFKCLRSYNRELFNQYLGKYIEKPLLFDFSCAYYMKDLVLSTNELYPTFSALLIPRFIDYLDLYLIDQKNYSFLYMKGFLKYFDDVIHHLKPNSELVSLSVNLFFAMLKKMDLSNDVIEIRTQLFQIFCNNLERFIDNFSFTNCVEIYLKYMSYHFSYYLYRPLESSMMRFNRLLYNKFFSSRKREYLVDFIESNNGPKLQSDALISIGSNIHELMNLFYMMFQNKKF